MHSYKIIYHNGEFRTESHDDKDQAIERYNQVNNRFAKILLHNGGVLNKHGNRIWIDKLEKWENRNIFNSFFDRIFIINLDDREDRWKKVVKQMEEFKITNYERFSAIKPDFEKIDKSLYKGIYSKRKEYIVGSIGCKLSHYEVVKMAKERNYTRVLILEDDFILDKHSPKIMEKVADDIDKIPDWELLYLGSNIRHIKRRGVEGKQNIKRVEHALTTHAYVINSSIFDHILENAMGFPKEIDLFYIEMQKKRGNSYASEPLFIRQDNGFSDILKRNVKYRTAD